MTGGPFRLLRAGDRVQQRWANDGGWTREIEAGPGWRVSLADIEKSGPFSRFPGAERVLTVVDGPAVMLVVDGRRREAAPLAALGFDGSATVEAEVTAPVTALNLILTVDSDGEAAGRVPGAGTMEVLRPSGEDPLLVDAAPGGTTLVVALSDGVECDLPGDALLLQRFDAVRFGDGSNAIVTGPPGSMAAVIRIDGSHHRIR